MGFRCFFRKAPETLMWNLEIYSKYSRQIREEEKHHWSDHISLWVIKQNVTDPQIVIQMLQSPD